MNSLQPGLMIMAQSLGWALLHSLWQAMLVYASLRIVLKIIGKPSARLSYNLSFLALAGVFIWFVHTWVVNWNMLQVAMEQSNIGAVPALAWAPVDIHSNMVYLQQWLPLLALAYITGVLMLAIRVVYNYWIMQVYKKKDVVDAPPDWIDRLTDYKECLQIHRNVQLLFSAYVTVPMVTGFIKPVILVPVATVSQLSVEQLEAILIHELAHIKRQDYLFNIIQVAMETILFFNPFVWLLSAVIGREREHCCDDVVLEYTSQPLTYAHALTALETARQSPLAIAATGNKKLLFNRIKRIVEMKKNTINSPVAGVLLIACLATSLAWLTPVIAQTVKQHEKKQTGTQEKITIKDENGKTRTYRSMKDVPAKDRKAMAAPPVAPMPPGVNPDWVQPVAPVAPVAPIAPTTSVVPIAPIAPVSPMNFSGFIDSTVAIAMKEANKAIKEANISIADANKALAAIDWNEINAEMKKARKDMDKALKDIDWKEINAEMKKAREEMDKALKDVDWNAINADLQKAQKDANKEMRKAMKEVRAEQEEDKMEREVDKAEREAEKADRETEKADREAEKADREVEKTEREAARKAQKEKR